MAKQWELKLASGAVVVWEGVTGEEAARRYVDCHRDAAVVAWRRYPRHGLFVGALPIIEPGHPAWGKHKES